MQRTVVTLCGTSVLTNAAAPDQQLRTWLNQNSNNVSSEFSSEDKARLDEHVARARELLRGADLQKVKRLSAELNALVEMYGGDLRLARGDNHYLLHSHTYIGEAAAGLIADWLELHEVMVQPPNVIENMTTRNSEDFHWGVSELVKFCDEWIRPLRGQTRIVFNIAGGFKAMQGILNTLGMLYADELIYIFETGGLISIPRLPIAMDADAVVGEHLYVFRKMALGIPCTPAETEDIPESLLWMDGDGALLSGWGEVVWQTSKERYYAKGLLESPIDEIQYGPRFRETVEDSKLQDRLAEINVRIDDLARYILSNGRNNPARLDYKQLKGKAKHPCTHEIDAFADRDARRIYLQRVGNVAVLHELGKHL